MSHPRDQKLATVNLISPFFSSHLTWGLLLQRIAMIKNSKAYLADVPLAAANEVLAGGAINLNRKVPQKITQFIVVH